MTEEAKEDATTIDENAPLLVSSYPTAVDQILAENEKTDNVADTEKSEGTEDNWGKKGNGWGMKNTNNSLHASSYPTAAVDQILAKNGKTDNVDDTKKTEGTGDNWGKKGNGSGMNNTNNSTTGTKTEKKKKKKGLKLCSESALGLEQQVQMNLIKHQLAWQFLSCRQFWLFTVPQAILTMLSGILAFVATSDLLDEKIKVIMNTIVGSTSGIVVFLQTMSGVCAYGTRAAMHDSAAIDLRDLRDDLVLLKQKLCQIDANKKKEMVCFNKTGATINDDDDDDDDDSINNEGNGDTFEEIQTRFRQCLSGCKSTVPMALSEAFHGLDSNLMLAQSKDNVIHLYELYGHLYFDEFIYFKAYDILAGEILNSRYFPLQLPNSKKVVLTTMARLQEQIIQYDNFWKPKPSAQDENKTIWQRCFP